MIVANRNTLRGDYRLALVKDVFPGEDGKGRKFKLDLCTNTVISLYRGRFHARCPKNSLLYRGPIHFTVTFAGI